MYPSCKHDWKDPDWACPMCKAETLTTIKQKYNELAPLISDNLLSCGAKGCGKELCSDCNPYAFKSLTKLYKLTKELNNLCR